VTPYSAQDIRRKFEEALDKLTKGAAAVATANKLLQKSLDETRTAYKRRQELKRAARRSIPTAGVITLAGARKMIRTRQEKREKEANKRLEKQIQRDIERAAKKAQNEEQRKANQLVRFERIMERSRKQIARGFALNKERQKELQTA